MYAQCPECLTVYRISAEQLLAGGGQAECGSCACRFSLFPTLCDRLPDEHFEQLPQRGFGAQIPRLTVPAMRPARAAAAARSSLVADPGPRGRRPLRPPAPAPGFLRRREPNPYRTAPGWYVAVVALALLLLAQVAWVQRDLLLGDPRTRPLLEAACARIGCTLPPRADPGALRILSRDIRPHPAVPGALIISASLQNGAEHAQPWPIIEITLSDLNENRVAMRRFLPVDYLSDPDRIEVGLPAGALFSLSLEVEDPGRDAVAFEFRFR